MRVTQRAFYCGPIAGAPWNATLWPGFKPLEIACRCSCQELYIDPVAMDALQNLRDRLGWPIDIGSGHRCTRHNKDVGGAPNSAHLQLAFDIEIMGYSRGGILALAEDAGFTRFGLMETAIHLDTHPVDESHARMWTYGPASRKAWAGLFPAGTPDIRGG